MVKNQIRIQNFIITCLIIFFFIIIILNMILYYNNSKKLDIIKEEFYILNNEWTIIQYKTQNLLLSNNTKKAYKEWTKTLHNFKLNFNKTFNKKEIIKLRNKYPELILLEKKLKMIWSEKEGDSIKLSYYLSYLLDSIYNDEINSKKSLLTWSNNKNIKNIDYYNESINFIKNSIFLKKDFQNDLEKINKIVNNEIVKNKNRLLLINLTIIILFIILIILFILYNFKTLTYAIDKASNLSVKLNNALQIKEKFLAHVSHEFRTPMNGIVGMIQLLKKSKIEKDKQIFLKSLDTASSHLQLLINDLLDLIRLNNKEIKINNDYYDITQDFKNIIEYFKPQIENKNLTLEYKFDKNLHIYYGDRIRIGQILNNLLSNSIKYTEKGKISVNAVIKENNLIISVEDTGKGIEKKQIKNIFKEFIQLELNPKYSIHGLGIGLSIIKQLITLMNGKIDIQSTPGKGTTFIIKLQYNINKKIKEKMIKLINIEKIKKDNIKKEKINYKAVKILLAEDDAISRIYVEKIIKRQNWQIKSVENGEEVLIELNNNNYDLILMDINMPVLNGLKATEKIRKLNNNTKNIPIIAVTGHAFDEDKNKFLEIGMDDLLIKPYTENQLIDIIITYLKK